MTPQSITVTRVVERPWMHPRRYVVQWTTSLPDVPNPQWHDSGSFESRPIAEDAARGLAAGERELVRFDFREAAAAPEPIRLID